MAAREGILQSHTQAKLATKLHQGKSGMSCSYQATLSRIVALHQLVEMLGLAAEWGR
jgi:hypothetical protein